MISSCLSSSTLQKNQAVFHMLLYRTLYIDSPWRPAYVTYSDSVLELETQHTEGHFHLKSWLLSLIP